MTITLLIALSIVAVIIRQRVTSLRKTEIEHHYLQMLLLGDSHSERYTEEVALLANTRVKIAAVESIANLSPIIYRLESQWLDSIARSLHLTEFMLHRTRKSRGAQLILSLSLFSRIPLSDLDLKEIAPYTNSKNRMVRFFALLTSINADQKNILKHIAAYPSPLTPFEISQLLGMLRQGSITVAYQPMLSANNENLKMLGLAVVRHFSIEGAERQLRDIIAHSHLYSLRREALYTLSSIELTLTTPSILRTVTQMSKIERLRFLRYIASEGYSLGTISFFSPTTDRKYFDSLINSYKIKIECS
ncbi:MAG: hypothetical protein SNH94_03320 [Rikenellaceae bacterium]